MIWGVDNDTHEVIGTTFKPDSVKVGNEELENWLIRLLSPKINFHFYILDYDELSVVLLEVGAAFRHPVRFKNDEFIRVGSYKKKLNDHPEKERDLWRAFDQSHFEKEIAAENVSAEEVLRLLNYPVYFDLAKSPLPENRTGILEALKAEEMIVESKSGDWNITNFGAVLFAKKLSDFSHLKRKSVRFIQYKGTSKLETIREESSNQGYAVGYEPLIKAIMQLIPSNEVSLLRNHFLPTFKLIKKERVGSKLVKKHSKPQTPYERVLASEHVDEKIKIELKEKHKSLDPFELNKVIQKKLNRIYSLVDVKNRQKRKAVKATA